MPLSRVSPIRKNKTQDSEALRVLKMNLVLGYRILARYGIGVGLLVAGILMPIYNLASTTG